MNNLSDYTRRMDALRDQLVDLLRPETDHERSLIQWLRDSLSTDGLAAMVEMAERLRGVEYQRGWAAGVFAEVDRPNPSDLMRDQQLGDQRREGDQ